jgi:hypothetical protein
MIPEMPLSDMDRALSAVRRMMEARAALQMMLKSDYPGFINGWKMAIQEAMHDRKKSAMEVLCDMAERQRDQLFLLAMLAATLELIEDDAQWAGEA